MVVKQYFEGGLKMINLMVFAQALKITWLRKILQNESKWHLLIKKFAVIENILSYGSEYIESVLRNMKNYFWKDVFKALSNLQHQLNMDWDKSSPYRTPIFCNTNLLVGGKVSFISHG